MNRNNDDIRSSLTQAITALEQLKFSIENPSVRYDLETQIFLLNDCKIRMKYFLRDVPKAEFNKNFIHAIHQRLVEEERLKERRKHREEMGL